MVLLPISGCSDDGKSAMNPGLPDAAPDMAPADAAAPDIALKPDVSSTPDQPAKLDAGPKPIYSCHQIKSGWCQMNPSAKPVTSEHLYAVWGAGSKDVFVGGAKGTILHFDGKAWTAQKSGTTSRIASLWGVSGSEVYAVTESGDILAHDGKAWSVKLKGPPSVSIGSAWWASKTKMWATASKGTYTGLILSYDGKAWTTVNTLPYFALMGVWGRNAKEVWLAGSGYTSHEGLYFRFDGTKWDTLGSSTTAGSLLPKKYCTYLGLGIWGVGANDLYVTVRNYTAQEQITLRRTNSTWAAVYPFQNSKAAGSKAWVFWGQKPSDVFFFGSAGVVSRWDGKVFKTSQISPPNGFNAAWGTSSSDLFVVGNKGLILHYKH